MHIDLTLTAAQLHTAYLLIAAIGGLLTMVLALMRPTLLSALVLFGGPFARMAVVTAFFGAVVLGFHGSIVSGLAYLSLFLICQIAPFFLVTNMGGKLSKRTKRELMYFLATAAAIGALAIIVPPLSAIAIVVRLIAAAGLFTYWKFAGHILEDMSHIDDTAWNRDK